MKSFFYRFIPKKIWQQIFLILLFLVVIPLVVTGIFLIQTSQEVLHKTIEGDLSQITEHATGEVVKDYEGVLRTLSTTASILGTLQADPWRQETAIVELSLRFPMFRSISSVDLNGQNIASSQLGFPLKNEDRDSILKCAMQGKTCVSEVRIALDYTPVLDIAIPIRHLGKTSGVLLAEYSLRGIWDVVDHIQFDHGGEAFLIDSKGQIIASKDKKQVLRNQSFPYKYALQKLLNREKGSHIEKDQNGIRWVLAFAPVGNLGWSLCIAQPIDQAFALVDVLYKNSWLLIILSLFAAGMSALLLATRMSRPIEQLVEATKQLARGDVNVTLPVLRKDEMGRLMFSFNSMSQQIKKARHMEKLSIVGRSATSIAHELKNSLTLVKTFIQLLPERHKDKAFVKESTETILKEFEVWNSMLRNMMDFAKEPMPFHKTFMPINGLIEDVTALAKLRAEDLGLKFYVDITPVLPAIEADRERLKQVLVNLINNAFEGVNPRGTITVKSLFNRRSEPPYVEIQVCNSGDGVKAEHLEKIFAPFFTTKEGGLGLGLSISRDIVHRHAGRLEVKSQPGLETVFIIKLPVYSTSTLERNNYDFIKDSYSG